MANLKFIDTIIQENAGNPDTKKLEIGSQTLTVKIIKDPIVYAKLRAGLRGRVKLLLKSYKTHPSLKSYAKDLDALDEADRAELFTKACLMNKMIEEDIPDFEFIRLAVEAFQVFEEIASAISLTSRSKTGVQFADEDELEEAGE